MDHISALCILPNRFIRPKNTDWRHGIFLRNSFSEFGAELGISFHLRDSLPSILSMNWRYLAPALARRLHMPLLGRDMPDYFVPLFTADKASRHDVLYAYGCYPKESRLPVLWHTGPTDINLLLRRGTPAESIEKEINAKRICVPRSAAIAVSSTAGQSAFESQFPESKGKVCVLPFLLRNVKAIDELFLKTKHMDSSPIDMLFVGREARRKGLDILIESYQLARRKIPSLRLTVVSSMTDGTIKLPSDVRYFRDLAHADIQKLMRSSHIYAMPSREESYGLVFIEAFAAGAAVIGPNREPQRSLFNHGACGVLIDDSVDNQVGRLGRAIVKLCDNPSERLSLAKAALQEFNEKYCEHAVLSQYANLLRATARGSDI